MSTEAFRSAVHTLVESTMAGFPGIHVFYENGPEVDEAAVGDIFLDVEIRWYSAKLTALGLNSPGRDTGAISLQVYYKSSEGTKVVDELVDDLRDAFKAKRVGNGITQMPQRSVPTHLKGWYKSGIFVPFHLDT